PFSPPDLSISMEMMEWFSICELYPTILTEWPNIPMIAWVRAFPPRALLRVRYQHNLLKKNDGYLYFYALGTGKYFSTYQKEAVAFLDISMPVKYDMARLFLDKTQYPFAVTEESDSEGKGQRVVSIHASAMFGPFTKDVIGEIADTEINVPQDNSSQIRLDYKVEYCGTQPPGVKPDVILKGNTLVVSDQVYWQCCPEFIRMTILVSGSHVIFTEKVRDGEAQCDCMCYFPISGKAGPFSSGAYQVELVNYMGKTLLYKEIFIEEGDADGDGIEDDVDNCPEMYNPDQKDNDNDGSGDICDECPDDPDNDIDDDGVCGDVDNCPDIENALQIDTDGDGLGDACDPDDDNDGLPDIFEQERTHTNPLLMDTDGDGIHDGDEDPDNDGFTNKEEYEAGSDPLDPLSVPGGYMTEVRMELPAGWSMISLPVKPKSLSVSDIFPDAKVIYGFEKGAGYIRMGNDEALEIGKGYWILFYEEQSFALIGQPVCEYTLPLDQNGWYMIGGCSYPAHFTIDTGNIGVIYYYLAGSGYKRIPSLGNLDPGKGYWIFFSNITGQARFHVDAEIADGDPIILANGSDPEDWDLDHCNIEHINIACDRLQIKVSYGGGCREHEFKLAAWSYFLESYPVQANILLSHNANDDPCDAVISETLYFDLSPLKDEYRKMYPGDPHGSIILRLYRYNNILVEYKF
ncbi:MAG: thrombospondin type 3 repeat-containing protein, partial [bacterium]